MSYVDLFPFMLLHVSHVFLCVLTFVAYMFLYVCYMMLCFLHSSYVFLYVCVFVLHVVSYALLYLPRGDIYRTCAVVGGALVQPYSLTTI